MWAMEEGVNVVIKHIYRTLFAKKLSSLELNHRVAVYARIFKGADIALEYLDKI